MDTTARQELLGQVERVARGAGEILRRGLGLRQVNFADAKDVKLQADLASEAYCRRELGAFSDFPIVGEEEGGDESLPSGEALYWVVDPLDGTFNYLREFGLCCVSIGLMRGSQPVLGVIFDFNTGELFSGGPGLGLRVNGEACQPRWAERLDQAVLATGFPSARDYGEAALRTTIRQIQAFNKVRMIGSAALAAAYVACGRMDVYQEDGCRWWDIAAGVALAEAVGMPWYVRPWEAGAPFQVSVGMAAQAEWLELK